MQEIFLQNVYAFEIAGLWQQYCERQLPNLCRKFSHIKVFRLNYQN